MYARELAMSADRNRALGRDRSVAGSIRGTSPTASLGGDAGGQGARSVASLVVVSAPLWADDSRARRT